MVHGNGHWSERKERGFHASLWVSLQISMSMPSYPFWYADLNAGSGWNEVRKCDGSPVVFLKCATDFARPYHAFFCDKEEDAQVELAERLVESRLGIPEAIQLVHMDNADFLPMFAKAIRAVENPKFAFGAVLVDPNGFPDGFPLSAIIQFAAEFPRIDLILNVNSRLLRKAIGARDNGPWTNWGKNRPAWTVLEIIDLIDPRRDRDWKIRNPPPNGYGDTFITFVGRSIRSGVMRDLGFFDLCSHVGRRIATDMKHIEIEQRNLFDGEIV